MIELMDDYFNRKVYSMIECIDSLTSSIIDDKFRTNEKIQVALNITIILQRKDFRLA